jgi:NADH-quinone oxidoreductase subunit M
METSAPILSCVIFLPLLGGVALLWIPRDRSGTLFGIALAVSLAAFLLSVKILWEFDPAGGSLQFAERRPWIPAYGIHYFVALDGLSLFLFLLTTFLGPLVILASWTVRERTKEYLFFMLALETGMLGTFAALDLFLFYVFWEVMLVPMYFLIGVWGGPRRTYAAIKFVVYTMCGSLLMLVAIIYLAAANAAATQAVTFDLFELYRLNLPYPTQIWLFGAFAL